LKKVIKDNDVQGFAEVIVSHDVTQGLAYLLQGAGLGALKHNTVLMGWPEGWRAKLDKAEDDDMLLDAEQQVSVFLEALSICSLQQHAVVVPKNIHLFPRNADKEAGTIDVWWILHEGGLLLLLGYLLQQDAVWRKCRLRVFTVAENDDNTIQLQRDLQTFLYHLRIDADIQVGIQQCMGLQMLTVILLRLLRCWAVTYQPTPLTVLERWRSDSHCYDASASTRSKRRR
jgi:potassium/chloride transporter 4/5/6